MITSIHRLSSQRVARDLASAAPTFEERTTRSAKVDVEAPLDRRARDAIINLAARLSGVLQRVLLARPAHLACPTTWICAAASPRDEAKWPSSHWRRRARGEPAPPSRARTTGHINERSQAAPDMTSHSLGHISSHGHSWPCPAPPDHVRSCGALCLPSPRGRTTTDTT
jgi:hypothetical protein